MADITDTLLGDNSKRALSALLFIGASTNAMDVYSALNSSPWTAESFGGDPEKAAACREYVYHSIAITSFYAIAASLISQNIWPLIGQILATAYMWWLYNRALNRAASRQSRSWNT